MQCSVKGTFDCHPMSVTSRDNKLMGPVLCCQAETEEEVLVRYFAKFMPYLED